MQAAVQRMEESVFTLCASRKGRMHTAVLLVLGVLLYAPTHADERNTSMKDVTLFYEAFNTKDFGLIDRILSEHWEDIPAAPGQPPGRAGAKHIIGELTTTFPDLKVTIEEILQEGNKVIVRSTITGTQRAPFMGFPAKNRTMTIQAVDVHEFHDGTIVRTWHTEDWLTGLHQLGVFEK